jgi:hypothetical protein
MTPAERERVAAYLSETREDLLRTMRGLSPTQLQYKTAPDRWSVADCLEHITVVEGLILSNIHKALQRESDSTKPAMSDDEILRTVTDRSNRVKGPEYLMPSGRWAHNQLFSEFEAARKGTSDFAAATNAPLRRHGYPHPLFGQFDCYQWILCIAAHEERHRLQAEEVISDSGFPRAAAAR